MASALTPPTDHAESESDLSLQQPPFVSFSISHPRLCSTDPRSIRVFLRKYDHYVKEVQLAVVNSKTTELCRVNLEWLESTITLDYTPGVTSVN